MHPHKNMPCSLLTEYKRRTLGWPHPVCSSFSSNMEARLVLTLFLIVLTESKHVYPSKVFRNNAPYYIPSDYYAVWKVVARNSSGELYSDTTPNTRRVFIWKPFNGSLVPQIFFEKFPIIVPDPLPTSAPGTLKRIVLESSHVPSQPPDEELEKKVYSRNRTRGIPHVTPATAALELPPPRKETTTKAAPVSLGQNLLHFSLKTAKLMEILSKQRSSPNIATPPPSNDTHDPNGAHDLTRPGNVSFVSAREEIDLTKESTRLFHIRREKQRIKRQISPDAAEELGLSHAQLNSLQAQVNRRFLTGYDCAHPQEVKPVSSFVQDPCEPIEANQQDTYEIDDAEQYQIVQYETRREFKGTRCEKYVSKFTYYCGTADHSSPYPQEIYHRQPKILHWNRCKDLATLHHYIAEDLKTYEIPINIRTEVQYFAIGSATAYTGWEGNQITCSGGELVVDGKKINHIVMYVTEEILYRKEKFILREDEDGIFAHYDNVRLTCPVEDEHCVGGEVTYVWRVPLADHCPLYHVRNLRGQTIKHEVQGITTQTNKIVVSTDQ